MTEASSAPSDAVFEDFLRVRMSPELGEQDGMVAGNDTLDVISDLLSFVLYGFDGFNGLLAGYDKIEFLRPVYVGDILHGVGRITRVGNRSRGVECEVYRVAEGPPRTNLGPLSSSARRLFDAPELVARARATMVLSPEAIKLESAGATGREGGHSVGGPGRAGDGLSPAPSDAVFEDFLRVRMSPELGEQDGMVAGNDTLDVISDLLSFVLYGFDGFNGLLAGYDKIEFLRPVYVGDILHGVGRITRVGNRSRGVECEVYRVAEGPPRTNLGPLSSSARRLFDAPELVARAQATMVLSPEAIKLKSAGADGARAGGAD